VDGEEERLLSRARDLRPWLRAAQEETERSTRYSAELHEQFLADGFYQILQPRRFGGLELGLSAFYRVIIEIARGCPSTAWCLCLGAEHVLQIASFFSERAQREVFAGGGPCISPFSGNGRRVRVIREPGGYRVSGSWGYCSGAPYSTHFLGLIKLPPADLPAGLYWFVVPRSSYTVLDDWTGVLGMRGSGSNSIVLDRVFLPYHLVVAAEEMRSSDGDTPGSALHGAALYGGTFPGFSEGDIAAIAAGTAMAVIDEYADLVATPNKLGQRRADDADYQRWLGTALAQADAAAALTVDGGRQYEEHARRSVSGATPFSYELSARLRNTYFIAQRLAWESADLLIRMAGSGAVADGRRMQRYLRDMVMVRTRFDQLERVAAETGRLYLENGASMPLIESTRQ
jgi:3-hydroxy-9,10-secoandrosta-1,3,5(10)-triene-9,17-dione monooxygenase